MYRKPSIKSYHFTISGVLSVASACLIGTLKNMDSYFVSRTIGLRMGRRVTGVRTSSLDLSW